jgi:hypothetical protein
MSAKRQFWEDLEDVVRSVTSNEKLFIGGDLKGHVSTTNMVCMEASGMAPQTTRAKTSWTLW